MKNTYLRMIVSAALLLSCASVFGQDRRYTAASPVPQPTIPATCGAPLTATLTNNSGVPSSQSAYDTTRVQTAINACKGTNETVELAVGSGGANAFLLTPITLYSGVILRIDAGVTVFASLDPSQYNNSSPGVCGTISATGDGKGCNPLISIPKDTKGTGIMGPGTIDGQGGQTLLNTAPPQGWAANCPVQTNYSWWCLTDSTKVVGGIENNPILVVMANEGGFMNAYSYTTGNGNNLVIYETTFQNAPNGHLSLGDCLSCTIYGITINTPMKAHETDGIDLGSAEDVTVYGSTISDGDDNIATGGTGSYAGEYISVYHDHIFSGHGVSIGSETSGGTHDIDVNTVSFSGGYTGTDDYTAEDTAINIKSAQDRGGIVKNVSYSNICMQNVARPIQIDPFYDKNSGTLYPQFGPNIALHNVTEIGTTPAATDIQIQGYSATYPLSLQLDNVILYDVTQASLQVYPPEYATITIGPGPVTDLLADTLENGKNTDITIINDGNNGEPHYACPGTFGFGTLPALP